VERQKGIAPEISGTVTAAAACTSIRFWCPGEDGAHDVIDEAARQVGVRDGEVVGSKRLVGCSADGWGRANTRAASALAG